MELEARYGRKKGFLRHHLALALHKLGAFAEHEPDWDSVQRLVFVCQGNICRSAYAEARARMLGLNTASFGLDAGEGSFANPVALERAASRGVDLAQHRARRRFATAHGDLLLAMEPSHLKALDGENVTLLGLWATPARPHLEDPYGLSRAYFDTCFDVIDSALRNIAQRAWRARER